MKQLKVMEKEGLLRSDSYGLGVEKLWRIEAYSIPGSPKRNQLEILKLYGVSETGRLDSYFYDHEIVHGWTFVALVLAGQLKEYKRNFDPALKDDARFEFGPDLWLYYLEVEMGKHSDTRLEEKIRRYMKHYRETKEQFFLLFVELTEEKVESRLEMFERIEATQHYQVVLFSDLFKNPLKARISNIFDTFTLTEKLPNTFQTPSNSVEESTA